MDKDFQSSDKALKRKRDEEKAQDPKLKEYLSLMQTSSKTRTWANDDGMVNPTEAPVSVSNQPAQDPAVVEELPSHPKKARVQEASPGEKDEEPKPVVVDQSGADEGGDKLMLDDPEGEDEEKGEAAPVSDADWLRSKTSRLLGLLDEDEQAEFDDHKVEEPAKPRSRTPDEPESRNAAIENIAAETPQPTANNNDESEDDEEQDDVVRLTAEQNKNIDLIRESARLFVRNLAYDTTDGDLEPLFAKYGKLDEVSDPIFLSILSHCPPPPLNRTSILEMPRSIARMMSFLIGTSDAKGR